MLSLMAEWQVCLGSMHSPCVLSSHVPGEDYPFKLTVKILNERRSIGSQIHTLVRQPLSVKLHLMRLLLLHSQKFYWSRSSNPSSVQRALHLPIAREGHGLWGFYQSIPIGWCISVITPCRYIKSTTARLLILFTSCLYCIRNIGIGNVPIILHHY
jgi:hypothetical protein